MTDERAELLARLQAVVQQAWQDARVEVAPHGVDVEQLIRPVVEAELALRQFEHEADLGRARLKSYQLGALVVVDTFRSRLAATAGVPPRVSLLAFMRTMERTEGGRA